MTLETLVSAVKENTTTLASKMNLESDAIIINQCNINAYEAYEYGNTDLNAIIAGDKNFAFESNESFEKSGFTKQEFDADSEELVNVEDEEPEMDDFAVDFDDDLGDE